MDRRPLAGERRPHQDVDPEERAILKYEAIRASVAQAQANLRAAVAARHQVGRDLAAQAVADVATLRDADRQLDLYEGSVLPRARQVVTVSRSAYESGSKRTGPPGDRDAGRYHRASAVGAW